MTNPTLEQLASDLYAAKEAFHKAIEERFAPGLHVHVRTGERVSPAEVIQASWERVKVRGDVSRKEYWVSAYRLVEFDRL